MSQRIVHRPRQHQRDQPRVVLAAARASHVRQVPPTDVLPENRLPAAPVDHAVAHDARVSHAVAIDQRLAAVAFLGDRAADARLQIVVARVPRGEQIRAARHHQHDAAPQFERAGEKHVGPLRCPIEHHRPAGRARVQRRLDARRVQLAFVLWCDRRRGAPDPRFEGLASGRNRRFDDFPCILGSGQDDETNPRKRGCKYLHVDLPIIV